MFPVIKEKVHPDEKLEPRQEQPCVAFPADTLWAKPNGILCVGSIELRPLKV